MTRRNPAGIAPVDVASEDARFILVDVVLRKLGKGSRAVAGRLVRAPRKGSVVVIEGRDEQDVRGMLAGDGVAGGQPGGPARW